MKKQNQSDRSSKQLHPGSSTEDAKAVGGKGDFGVREDDVAGRTYTSRNTKQSDPGNAQPHAGDDESRTSGVGGTDSGPGSSSGGDLDTDIVGVGTGSGVAASGKIHSPAGPDDSDGTSREFASGPPAEGKNQTHERPKIRGTTHSRGDESTMSSQGADSATSSNKDNDAFAGEVSSSEASGRDDAGD